MSASTRTASTLSLNRLLTLLIACAALGGCASNGSGDSSIFLAPTGLSDLYTRANMEVMLAITPHEQESCFGPECDRRAAFDKRVARLGARLADAAYLSYPALKERIPQFTFTVVDKTEAGTASAPGGLVVVLRPVSAFALSDEALSFVIARELGHVVSQHHERNTAISLTISVVTMALAPVVNIAKLLAVLYGSSSAAAASTLTTSAASFAGSRAIIESYWPTQRQEADVIAMRLIAPMGYNAQTVIAGIAQECSQSPTTRWVRELQESVAFIVKPAPGGPELPRVAQAATPLQTVIAAECTAAFATASLAATVAVAGTTVATAECTAAFATDIPSGTLPAIAQNSGRSTGESDTSVALVAQPRPAESADLPQSPH